MGLVMAFFMTLKSLRVPTPEMHMIVVINIDYSVALIMQRFVPVSDDFLRERDIGRTLSSSSNSVAPILVVDNSANKFHLVVMPVDVKVAMTVMRIIVTPNKCRLALLSAQTK